ncbi:MAG: dihydrodipicolinate synthase family protein [Deltaproteobacteria bacterium]|jgi:4-hydroxy-tetrahydrodipicolinate synthase|nr:dihydrodipicolinate synthase family protein [Deltaproteobacteria bacterium]
MKGKFLSPAVSIFDKKGRLDREDNHRLYEHMKNGGISGFVIMGSTGEFYGMSLEECKSLIDIASDFPKGDMLVLSGASRMKVDESVMLSNYTYDKGLDGSMIISPYYAPLSQENVFDFYSRIASKTRSDIYIYNYPARTGYSIEPGTVLRLLEKFENIKGIKDTILDMFHTCDLIREIKPRFPNFEVYSGYDNNFAHNVLSGGNGCIGALSNIAPHLFSGWIEAMEALDLSAVAGFQRKVDEMMDIYKIGGSFIPIIKKALSLMGIIRSGVSLAPLEEPGEKESSKVRDLLISMGIITEIKTAKTE